MRNHGITLDPYWERFEDAARSAVIAGGIASMSYFRGVLADPKLVSDAINAATTADVQSTAAILLSLNTTIPNLAGEVNLGHSIFAEELDGVGSDEPLSHLIDRLGATATHVKRTAGEFEKSFDSCIGVLFDAIDGTTNFRTGLPLFCSAMALFIGGEPRVGAVYDPCRNVVYYGSLRETGIPLIATASMWHVSSGMRQKLNVRDEISVTRDTARPRRLIATHLTRSDAAKRLELLKCLACLQSIEGTFMINSGQLSLALLASGHFSAYINNYTNTWDIAAGEVLVRAVGGQVTDFNGHPVQYGGGAKVNVIASTDEQLHDEILTVVGRGYSAGLAI